MAEILITLELALMGFLMVVIIMAVNNIRRLIEIIFDVKYTDEEEDLDE